MRIEYNVFNKILREGPFEYIDRCAGLPFGSIRVTAVDPLNVIHSAVLTKSTFIKYFGVNAYANYFRTDLKCGVGRLGIKPWFEYSDLDKEA